MLRIILLLLCLLPGLALSAERTLTGSVRVIDGDSFEVAGERIRLFGIDAVETGQFCGGKSAPTWACGAWVTAEVRARYEGRVLACDLRERDRYGRWVAVCRDGAQDVGRALVQAGLAFAYLHYSTAYAIDEGRARARAAGLFATGVQSPGDFRATGRAVAEKWSRIDAPAGCTIKGNISRRSGERIYHVEGQAWYGRTKISAARGERWFCSEDEARAAGWRRAKV